ncbi:MAG TPA: MotA/TolQ/ExbB proton channel family protein, partial [Akkermansia sp.]|nr:MotA/TolQ/ExbB proton channel family protein [Akkermansia sp.]
MNPVPFTTLAAAMDFVVGDRNYPLSELFMKGGFIMWPLLLLSIAGVVVLVMCCFSTRAAAVLPTKLVEQAESFIRKRDYTGLSILCKNGDSCYARVMLTVANFMLRNPSAQFEEVREIASAEGGRQAGFLSRQISWLSDIGAVAPMLGLLGTVVGMMKTFFEIANGDFSGGKQRIDMAGGGGGGLG